MKTSDRIKIHDVTLLAQNWGRLNRTRFSFLRSNGKWQEQTRETYDRGDGATILLYNLARRSVVLIRQFRLPAFVNKHDGLLIEAPAGKLDGLSPEECIRAETEQETGYRVSDVRRLFSAFMSPGSVTERIHFFMGAYEGTDRVTQGGGLADEGEDIEVLEIAFDKAYGMIASGEIADGKTIMLLQYAALHLFKSR